MWIALLAPPGECPYLVGPGPRNTPQLSERPSNMKTFALIGLSGTVAIGLVSARPNHLGEPAIRRRGVSGS